jgi:hypothetical protein
VAGYVDSQPGTAQGSPQGQTERQAGDRPKFLDVKMTPPGATTESVILLASEGSQVHRSNKFVAKRDEDHDILSHLLLNSFPGPARGVKTCQFLELGRKCFFPFAQKRKFAANLTFFAKVSRK